MVVKSTLQFQVSDLVETELVNLSKINLDSAKVTANAIDKQKSSEKTGESSGSKFRKKPSNQGSGKDEKAESRKRGKKKDTGKKMAANSNRIGRDEKVLSEKK